MTDTKTEIIVYRGPERAGLTARGESVTARNAPAIVKAAGRSAEFAWEEFFQAEIANAHTRKNYLHAVRKFLAWVEGRGLDLPRITPGDVGAYLQGLDPLSVPTKKLHLAALIPSPENSRAPIPRIVSIGQDRLGVGITPGA